MWNLLKGRCSYTAKLEVEGEAVHFLPGGDAYVLLCGNKVGGDGWLGERMRSTPRSGGMHRGEASGVCNKICPSPRPDAPLPLSHHVQVTVHSTSGEGGILSTLSHARRVLCSAQPSENVLLTGVEDGSVKVGNAIRINHVLTFLG